MPASTTGRPAAVLSVLVTANTRSAQANLAALDRQMAYSVKRTGAGAAVLQRSLVGLRFAAVGFAAATAGSVAAAVKYESAFASVRKTVQGTDKQLNTISDAILDMSEKIPESASALAELAGEAGALGVRRKDLVSFTKTASQLGTTTNMTSNAAADGLARLANIMDTKGKRAFHRMGSVLVDLGNKGASTEAEITAMSLRIAGAGKLVGLTESEVMGLAASLANLGIRAEMGGSAISRVMKAMQTSIAEGGAELELWAKTTGMSVAQFKASFEKDVPATIAAFADGLIKIQESGGSAQSVLVELGKAAHTSMGEIRVSDTLARIAGNTEQFARQQHIANKEWGQNNALTVEAQKRYETLESQLQLLRNSITRVGIDLGTSMLPDLKEVVSILSDSKLTLPEKMDKMFTKLGDIIGEYLPKFAAIGGKLGLAIMTGIGEAFLNASPLGQAVIFAGMVRLFGGRGALTGLGMMIVRPILTAMGAALASSAAVRAMKGAMAGLMIQAVAGSGPAWFAPSTISPLGAALGSSLATAAKYAIPGAFAAAGVANVIADVIGGDMRGAAFEAGGVAAGALAGGLVGGLPGALIGAGIGSVLGDLLGDVFSGGGEAPLKGMKLLANQIATQSRQATESLKSLVQAHRNQTGRIKEAKDEDRKATNRLKQADEELTKARQKFGPRSREAIEAEHRYAEAKRESGRASRKLERAERLPRFEREHMREELKRIIGPQKAHLGLLEKQEKRLFREYKELKRSNAEWPVRSAAFDAWQEKGRQVAKQQDRVNETLSEASKLVGPKFARALDEQSDKIAKAGTAAQRADNKFKDLTGKLSQAATVSRGQTTPAVSNLRERVAQAGERAEKTQIAFERLVSDGFRPAARGAEKSGKDTEDAADKMSKGVVEALGLVGTETNKMLTALGVAKVNFGGSVEKSGKGGKPGTRPGSHARGGITGTVVPGTMPGDHVPVHVGGAHVANVERGEVVGVMNRKAAPGWLAANSEVNRYAEGGLAFALGPYTIPPITYDPDHAGGNSHWHISGSPPSWVVGVGERLQQMGFDVGEHPAFGGVSAVHGHYGPTDHYHGGAIDVNSAANETRQETAAVAALLRNGKMTGAFAGAVVEKIAKVMFEGPDGALKSVGQGAVDKVSAAANRYIAENAPSSLTTGGVNVKVPAGSLSVPEMESLWRRVNRGIGDAHLMAAIGMAESSGNPNVTNSIGARGLWQIIPSTASAFNLNYDKLTDPAYNALGAGKILQGQGLGAWEAYTLGLHQQYLAKGGTIAVGDSLLDGVLKFGGGFPGGWDSYAKPDSPSSWSAGTLNSKWDKGALAAVFTAGTNDKNSGTLKSSLKQVKGTIGDAGLALMTLAGPNASSKNNVIRGFNRTDAIANWAGIADKYVGDDGIDASPAGYKALQELLKAAGNKAKKIGKRRSQQGGDGGGGQPDAPVPNIPGGTEGSFKDILNVRELYRYLLQAGGPGDRRALLADARARIKKTTALGFLSADGSSLAGRLGKLRGDADLFGENASFAADLGFEDANGVLTKGVFQGLDEGGWLNRQLDTLFVLRNELIAKERKTFRGSKSLKKLVDAIKGPKGLLYDIGERMKDLKARIKQLEKDRKKLEKQLQEASNKAEHDKGSLRERLERELDKPKKKRDEDLIQRLRQQLRKPSSEKDAVQAEIDALDEKLKTARQGLTKQTTVRDAFKGTILENLRGRRDAVTSGDDFLLEELRTVQGGGVSMDIMEAKPPFGTLSGEYGAVEVALRNLGLQTNQSNGSGLDPFTIADLLEFSQAVRAGAFGKVTNSPWLGAFAEGGVAMVGEKGPELAHFPSGTRIHNAEDSREMMAPNFEINVYVGDKPVQDAVVEVVDKRNRDSRQRFRAGRR